MPWLGGRVVLIALHRGRAASIALPWGRVVSIALPWGRVVAIAAPSSIWFGSVWFLICI